MISDVNGNPAKFILQPASESDIGSFKKFDKDLTRNSFKKKEF